MPESIRRLIARKKSAVRYLDARGCWVVLCRGKVPIKSNWPNVRTTPEELEAALNANPTLSIAIVLSRSGVIDVEYDNGDEGEATVLELFGGRVPPTPTFDSPRGRHRLFRRSGTLEERFNTAKVDFKQIEFRGLSKTKGALSVVPPSCGRRWLEGLSLDDVEPAELPDELLIVIGESCASNPHPHAPADPEKIPEGRRNDALFAKALALFRTGITDDAVLDALLAENARRCDPPLPEAEVGAIVKSAAKYEDDPRRGFLERFLRGVELWHDLNGDPFATLPVDDHREHWPVGKKCLAYRRWISHAFYKTTGEVLKDGAFGELTSLVEATAVFEGRQHPTFRRVGEADGRIYVDLGDDRWRAVEVSADGYRVVDDPPVKFCRARAMLPLPEPVPLRDGESLKSLLLPLLNLRVEDWPLVAAWLVAALRPRGPYPVLKLLGEQGAAKTTTARVLRQLVDPNAAPVRAEPRTTRDLMISANNAHLLCFDNLSAVRPDLSDALCRLSTGGGFSTRTLYADTEETIFEAVRPVILTSIEEIGAGSDLLERSLILELPRIDESKRRAEKKFWAEFEAARPRIFAALLEAISGALGNLPEVEAAAEPSLSRMADFEQWALAAEAPLGLAAGEFAEAYRANRERATHVALESSPVVAALVARLKWSGDFEGTATDLLRNLRLQDPELTRAPGWPKTPRVLSQILKRVAPNLRQVGVVAEQGTRGGGDKKQKIWRVSSPFDPQFDAARLSQQIRRGTATRGRKPGSHGRSTDGS